MLTKALRLSSVFFTAVVVGSIICPPLKAQQVKAQQGTEIAQEQPSRRYQNFIVLVGKVRNDRGYFYGFGPQENRYLGDAGWNDCPRGFRLVGRHFHSNGFWLCARNDVASSTFYVGNVLKDVGYYYELSIEDGTHQLNNAGWNYCRTGQFLGRNFESNGFWVCMDPVQSSSQATPTSPSSPTPPTSTPKPDTGGIVFENPTRDGIPIDVALAGENGLDPNARKTGAFIFCSLNGWNGLVSFQFASGSNKGTYQWSTSGWQYCPACGMYFTKVICQPNRIPGN